MTMRLLIGLGTLSSIGFGVVTYTGVTTRSNQCVADKCADFDMEPTVVTSVDAYLSDWKRKVSACKTAGEQATGCIYSLEITGTNKYSDWCKDSDTDTKIVGLTFSQFESLEGYLPDAWATSEDLSGCLQDTKVFVSKADAIVEDLCSKTDGTEAITITANQITVGEDVVGFSAPLIEGQTCPDTSEITATVNFEEDVSPAEVPATTEAVYTVTPRHGGCDVKACGFTWGQAITLSNGQTPVEWIALEWTEEKLRGCIEAACEFTIDVGVVTKRSDSIWCTGGFIIGVDIPVTGLDVDTTWRIENDVDLTGCFDKTHVATKTSPSDDDICKATNRDVQVTIEAGMITFPEPTSAFAAVILDACPEDLTATVSAHKTMTVTPATPPPTKVSTYTVKSSFKDCVTGTTQACDTLLGSWAEDKNTEDLQATSDEWLTLATECAAAQYTDCVIELNAHIQTYIGGDNWCDNDSDQISVQLPAKGFTVSGPWTVSQSYDMTTCIATDNVETIKNTADYTQTTCQTAISNGGSLVLFEPGQLSMGIDEVGFIAKKMAGTTCNTDVFFTADYQKAVKGTEERPQFDTTYSLTGVTDCTGCEVPAAVMVNNPLEYLTGTFIPAAESCYKMEGNEACAISLEVSIVSQVGSDEWCEVEDKSAAGVAFSVGDLTNRFKLGEVTIDKDLTSCFVVTEGFIPTIVPTDVTVCSSQLGTVEGVTLSASTLTLPEEAVGFVFKVAEPDCYSGAVMTAKGTYTASRSDTTTTTKAASGSGSSLAAASVALMMVAVAI